MASVLDTQKNQPEQDQRQDRLVTAYARAWQFFDEKSSVVYAALGGVVVLVLVIAGYIYYQDPPQAAAQEALASPQSVYASGDYEAALGAGDGQAGLLEVIDDYGSTDAGNLARLMAADAYYHLEQPDRALELL